MEIDYIKIKKRKKKSKPIIIYVLVIISVIVFLNNFSLQISKVISPIPDKLTQLSENLPLFKKNTKIPEELENLIKNFIGNKWSNYSIIVADLNSDFKIDIGGSVIFTAASVNKIPILATLYYLVQKGEIDLDQKITVQKKDVQDYGTGSIRYDPLGTTYSIKTLARLMIAKSDNTAAYVIANHIIGLNNNQNIIENWGLVQTDMIKNKTSNNDIYNLFSKIYHGQIVNIGLTKEMLAFFIDTDFEDRLPKLLPETASVYHKIGTEAGIVHDVGIVKSDNSTYYIGIMTSDITNIEETSQMIAEISKIVYEYLN